MTPTPNLQAAAMRARAADEATAWVRRAMHLSPDGYEIERRNGHMMTKASASILALPLEATPAELLAEAGELPEIAALIETMKKADQALHDDGCRPTMWPRPQIAIALKPFSALETP